MTAIVGILLGVLLILTPFYTFFHYKPFYTFAQQRLGVYDSLGADETKLHTQEVIGFITGDSVLTNFTQNEMSHLQDVRTLYQEGVALYWLLLALLVLGVGLLFVLSDLQRKRHLFRTYAQNALLIAGFVTLGILVVTGIAMFNFPWLFQVFHQVFFPQGNFAFAQGSLLISLFPVSFFKDFAILSGATSAALALACIAISIVLRKRASLGHD